MNRRVKAMIAKRPNEKWRLTIYFPLWGFLNIQREYKSFKLAHRALATFSDKYQLTYDLEF